jgi:hypothetical protein
MYQVGDLVIESDRKGSDRIQWLHEDGTAELSFGRRVSLDALSPAPAPSQDPRDQSWFVDLRVEHNAHVEIREGGVIVLSPGGERQISAQELMEFVLALRDVRRDAG